MAKARNRPPAPATETGRRELRVEPGTPPAPPAGDDAAVQLAGGGGDAVLEPGVDVGAFVDRVDEWELQTVEAIGVGVPCLALHFTLGRGGPDDAFLPDAGTRREIAEPLRNVLNRSPRLRRLAPFGDVGAYLVGFGTFVVTESIDVARYRAGRAAGETIPSALVEHELAGVTTRAVDGREPARPAPPAAPPPPAPTVRVWTPPTPAASE